MSKIICFTDEKTCPCVRSKPPRLYRHHAHMCFNMCARGAGTHGDVLNVHTGTCWVDTRSFEACHTLTHINTHTQHNTTQHNTTQHNTTQHITTTTPRGERETETNRDRERRQGQREEKTEEERQDKRREDKRRQDKRREKIHFAVWWCMAFFVGVVFCLVNPVCARFIQCPLAN